MKKIIILMLSLLIQTAYAYTGFGICNHGKETLTSVICDGPTVLIGTTVTQDLKLAGDLKAKKITIGSSMNVAGAVEITDSIVKGPTQIIGVLDAKNVDFQQNITISSDSITLNHTTVRGSMTITSKTTKPYLRLYCSTTITGSVLFDEEAGIIEVSEESIVQGKVVNGSIEFVKQSCD
jgi:hypothetical protein